MPPYLLNLSLSLIHSPSPIESREPEDRCDKRLLGCERRIYQGKVRLSSSFTIHPLHFSSPAQTHQQGRRHSHNSTSHTPLCRAIMGPRKPEWW